MVVFKQNCKTCHGFSFSNVSLSHLGIIFFLMPSDTLRSYFFLLLLSSIFVSSPSPGSYLLCLFSFSFPSVPPRFFLLLHQYKPKPKASTFQTFNATRRSLSARLCLRLSLSHKHTGIHIPFSQSRSLTVTHRNLHVCRSLVDGVNETEFTGSKTGENCRAHTCTNSSKDKVNMPQHHLSLP